jgi:fumarate hydratase subunit beta
MRPGTGGWFCKHGEKPEKTPVKDVMKRLITPLSSDDVTGLRSGDWLYLSGVVYTARDTAHKYIIAAMDKGQPLPFALQGAAVYYMGPSPAPPGRVIGAAGPTSSYRMDPYTPKLAAGGVKAFIGKGPRSPSVRQALCDNQAVYLAAVGGGAAFLAAAIKQAQVIAFPELGPEAVMRLQVQDMQLVCINDCQGHDLYRRD